MDMKFEKHCWAEIDLDALRHNFAYIRQAVGGPVCAVVKADAYGHGDVATAKTIRFCSILPWHHLTAPSCRKTLPTLQRWRRMPSTACFEPGAVQRLQADGVALHTIHCANSAAQMRYPEWHHSLTRAGIILYGLDPSPEVHFDGLRPTMTLKSVVAFVKDLLPGESVSYGRTYTANTPRKVATVCVGYADGYPRALSGSNGNPNAGVMSIRGKPAPIIGRVCMDQTLVDVTDIPDVKMNDEVTVFGPENAAIGADTADSIAAKTGTINYEIICGISRRVPRVYLRDGAPVRIWNDLEET